MEQFTREELMFIDLELQMRLLSYVGLSYDYNMLTHLRNKIQRMLNTSEVTESRQERVQRKAAEFGIRYGATEEQLKQDMRKYPRTEAESISPSERTEQGEPLTVHIPEEKAQALADELERILDGDLVNRMLALSRSSFKADKRWDNKDQGAGI